MEKYIELILTDPEMLKLVLEYFLLVLVAVFLISFCIYNPFPHINVNKKKIRRLSDQAQTFTPQEFLKLTSSPRAKKYDFRGVYILHNEDNGKNYVGQSQFVHQRVRNHFQGRGNGDVYVDYRYGAHFTIKFIPLENSGFRTLNALERNTIRVYHAYTHGYNKTRGNRG